MADRGAYEYVAPTTTTTTMTTTTITTTTVTTTSTTTTEEPEPVIIRRKTMKKVPLNPSNFGWPMLANPSRAKKKGR
jgi:hypothetical protein